MNEQVSYLLQAKYPTHAVIRPKSASLASGCSGGTPCGFLAMEAPETSRLRERPKNQPGPLNCEAHKLAAAFDMTACMKLSERNEAPATVHPLTGNHFTNALFDRNDLWCA